MTALLTSFVPWIGGAIIGLAGVIFAAFRHQQAKVSAADAAAAASAAAAAIAQKSAAEATANVAAAQAGVAAATAMQNAKADATAIPDTGLDDEGLKLGILRTDSPK